MSSKIKAFDGVRIAEKELREYVSVQDYNDYYKIIIELVNSNAITPVKSSGSNGMRPPLHKRYNIVKPTPKYDGLIQEIRLLNERFNIEGYLKGLNFNPGLKEALNFYSTPEPFYAFNIGQLNEGLPDRPLNILIIENKDTWYTLRNRMSPGLSSISGISFHCILYGEGRKISRINDSLTDFDRSYFKGVKTSYYYFGDLDYEGVGIIHDLMRVNPQLQINLMLPLYTAMLEASKGIQLPAANENQKRNVCEWFFSFFDAEHRSIIKSILESGHYIPQEILDNGEFMKLICGNSQDEEKGHV